MDDTFTQFLSEKFYNAFTDDQKRKYADQVWDILVQSYKSLGGMRGISSKEDMIKNIPMWKIAKDHDEVLVAILYKDRGQGRKLVAVGTNGSPQSKELLHNMLKKEFERSYTEISGPLFSFMNKHFPDLVKKYTIPTDQVEKILNKTVAPTRDGMYKRVIQGQIREKIMIGTPGKTIR